MIRLDIKNLRNFNKEGVRDCATGNMHELVDEVAGSECMRVAVDDQSRYGLVSIMEDETAECVTKNLIEYAARGMVTKRVSNDNGSGYKSKMFAEACQPLNV